MRCRDCPVAAGAECLGEAQPRFFPQFCRHAASGDPHLRHVVVSRSALGWTEPGWIVPSVGCKESTPVESSHSMPSVAESLARLKAMKACPHWSASSSCGCSNNRCAAGKGRDGVVSHRDCWECLGLD